MVDHRALVNPCGADLDISLAGNDRHRVVFKHRVEVDAHFLGLHHAKFRVDLVEFPHKAGALDVCLCPIRPSSVGLHHCPCRLFPRKVKTLDKLAPAAGRWATDSRKGAQAEEATVLGGKRGRGEARKGRVHRLASLARQHHEQVSWLGCQLLKARKEGGREALAVVFHQMGVETVLDVDQRASPIHEDGSPPRSAVGCEHFRRVERCKVGTPSSTMETC
mmetsp:Transcript_27567/g.83938  ORF Transcript_27567/g.83938 Transcript_27567/m.83938 type:complete len:220 (+) Transcript_27567:306-965(+)